MATSALAVHKGRDVLDVFEPLLHRVSRTGEPAQGLADVEEIVAGHRGARHEYLILKEKLVRL
jgi:hypothetical protein